MGLTILIGTLAAFGAFFVGFALMGWLLGSSRGFRLVYFPAADPAAGLFRYRMLRGLGLLTCPLVMADTALSPEEKAWLVKKFPVSDSAPRRSWRRFSGRRKIPFDRT